MKDILLKSVVTLCVFTLSVSLLYGQTWKTLFNGKDLSNWDRHIGTSLGDDFDDLAAAATVEKVFSVIDYDGIPVIHISGDVNGSLATRESFENYHLRMVFRWGDDVFTRRNSGLLYHSFGDFGVGLGTWMANIECQLLHQNMGDTYLMANTACSTSAEKNEEKNQFFYTPGAELVHFGEHASGRSIKKSDDVEKPVGEWNTVDLYCYGRTSVHVVNGKTVMVNQQTSVYEDGALKPLTSGKIQIQSEGGELFIKSIEVRPIDGLPAAIIP